MAVAVKINCLSFTTDAHYSRRKMRKMHFFLFGFKNYTFVQTMEIYLNNLVKLHNIQ